MPHFKRPSNSLLTFLYILIIASPLLYSCMYSSKAAQKLFEKSKMQVYDIVVVPGVPLENGKWSRTMKGRIFWAKYLYDKGITKNVMFSGAAVSSAYYEGIVMGQYAIALGIPKEHVFSEIKAEHSTENIYYGYYLAKKLGFNKIALASDPFQTKTLKSFTRRKVSPNVAMIPMLTDTMNVLNLAISDPVIDTAQAAAKDFIPLKKKYGFFKRLRGTMGYGIKKESK